MQGNNQHFRRLHGHDRNRDLTPDLKGLQLRLPFQAPNTSEHLLETAQDPDLEKGTVYLAELKQHQ